MLVQMLAGCLYVLKRECCALVGGHTAEGAECSMGLAVSGVAHPAKVFQKGLTGKYMKRFSTIKDSNGLNNPQGVDLNNESSLGQSSSSLNGVTCNGHLGHVLVLTKALGTGTIMAAHMRAKVILFSFLFSFSLLFHSSLFHLTLPLVYSNTW